MCRWKFFCANIVPHNKERYNTLCKLCSDTPQHIAVRCNAACAICASTQHTAINCEQTGINLACVCDGRHLLQDCNNTCTQCSYTACLEHCYGCGITPCTSAILFVREVESFATTNVRSQWYGVKAAFSLQQTPFSASRPALESPELV